jgi:hypothetical protein
MRGVRVVNLSLRPARFSYFLRQGAAVAFSHSACYCEWRGVWAVLRLRSPVPLEEQRPYIVEYVGQL